jgi:outer membrane translocation and assembly module TamA
MMNFSKKLGGLFLLMAFATASVFGQGVPDQQEAPSDDELKQFIGVLQHIQLIDQLSQQQMVMAIQEEEMEVQRFVELMQAQQDPNQEVETTPEEKEKYDKVAGMIEQIQVDAQEEMESHIAESGLTIMRYQEISLQIQTDEALQQRFQELIQQL